MTLPQTRDEAEDALLDAAVASLLAEEIPAGPPLSVADRVAEGWRKPAAGSHRPRRGPSRMAAWVAAASILVAGVLLWQLQESRGSVALAEVAEAFRKAKSLQFRSVGYVHHIGDGPVPARWRTADWEEHSWKSPGFRRKVCFDREGVPWKIETRDEARGITLELLLREKEATLTEEGPATAHQLRQGLPSSLVMLEDWLQYGQVQQDLGEKGIAGRRAVGLRVAYGERKGDFWVDRRTRQIIRFLEPTVDEYDPDNDPAVKTAPLSDVHITGTELKGGVWTDIVYDPPLDEMQFVLTPPQDYKVKRIRHRDPTEKDLLEWLEVFAHVHGGTFTDNENSPLFHPEEGERIRNTPADKQTAWEQKLLRDGSQKDSTEARAISLKGGGNSVLVNFWSMYHGTWHYQGKGVRLGDALTAVCWYRPDGAATFRVVFGDLSVHDVALEDLPKQSPSAGDKKAPEGSGGGTVR